MHNFAASKLDAYVVARDLATRVHSLRFPRGHAALRDQLRRSATSIVLNIAEGAGKTATGDKRRAYDIARGECAEARGALDLAWHCGLIDQGTFDATWEVADRVAAMLYRLVGRWSG